MGLGGISFRSIFLILFCVLLALSLWKTSPDLKKLLYRVAKIGSHEEPTSEEGQRIGKPAHIVNRMSVKIESPQETPSPPPAREEVSKVSPPASQGSAAESVSPTPAAPLMAEGKSPSDLAKQAHRMPLRALRKNLTIAFTLALFKVRRMLGRGRVAYGRGDCVMFGGRR